MTMTIHNRLYDLFLIRLCQDQYILFSDASGTDINHLDWYLISAADAMDSFNSWSPHADSRRRQWHSPPVLLPGKSHGQRSLAGYSPWGHKESDTTEWLSARTHTHTHTHTLKQEQMSETSAQITWSPRPNPGKHTTAGDCVKLEKLRSCWDCVGFFFIL